MKGVYVCGACGKTAAKTTDFNDVSCAMNAVLCKPESLVYADDGSVIQAEAIEND